jgi:phage terminase large subunit-like protein
MASWVGDGEPEPEIYSVAGDKDQAKIIFNNTSKAFKRSPVLRREVNIYKDVIERKDGRGIYKVLSADAPTAHGLNGHFVIWDELWNQRTYDLWEALTHSPARRQPLHFIVTYAGYDQYKGNLLWDLYQTGLRGDDPGMYMFWSHDNQASWVTQEYLKQQQRRLLTHVYMRLHENRWTSGVNNFLTRADVDGCIDPELGQRLKGDGYNYWVGVDLGLKLNNRSYIIQFKVKAVA